MSWKGEPRRAPFGWALALGLVAACQSTRTATIEVEADLKLEKPKVTVDEPARAAIRRVNVVLDERLRLHLDRRLLETLRSTLEKNTELEVVANILPDGSRVEWSAREARSLRPLVETCATQAVLFISAGWSDVRHWLQLSLYDPRTDVVLWECAAPATPDDSAELGAIVNWPDALDARLCERAIAALTGAVVEEEIERAAVTIVAAVQKSNDWTFALTRKSWDWSPAVWFHGPVAIIFAPLLVADIVFLPVALIHDALS